MEERSWGSQLGSRVVTLDVIDSTTEHERYMELIRERLASNDVSVIIAKRPCILQIKKLAKFQKGGAK